MPNLGLAGVTKKSNVPIKSIDTLYYRKFIATLRAGIGYSRRTNIDGQDEGGF
jgi:hypothetical protein